MKTSALWLGVILVCVTQVRAQASRVPETDNQSWNDIQLTIPLDKRTEFVIQGTLRLVDNMTDPGDERWGFRFNRTIEKHVTLQGLYFHREAKPPRGKAEYEDRLTFGANLRFPIQKFIFTSRNWFERRWRQPQVDAWRYRNRLQLEHPFKIGKTRFMWQISDEPFYDWSLHVWPRNRMSAGISHTFNKHLTLDLNYTRQNDSHTRPGDLNIIWSVWRVRL
ncbi:MAG TPA: DUF2490 domain-containing protein [Pyrinomonadaceae bacterium]|nr:DUF2490 domain-containing protein [Pyrinomonadaceae bacterium]